MFLSSHLKLPALCRQLQRRRPRGRRRFLGRMMGVACIFSFRKENHSIRQCLHWLTHMPLGMRGHNSTPIFSLLQQETPPEWVAFPAGADDGSRTLLVGADEGNRTPDEMPLKAASHPPLLIGVAIFVVIIIHVGHFLVNQVGKFILFSLHRMLIYRLEHVVCFMTHPLH